MSAHIFYSERMAMARMGRRRVLLHWYIRELWHERVAGWALAHHWLGTPARWLWRAYRRTWRW